MGGLFACIFVHALVLIMALSGSERVGVSVARVLEIATFCYLKINRIKKEETG